MPTVLRVDGFSVRIFKHDHEPAHVHVFNADGWCKVEIATAAVTKVVGMKTPDVRYAERLVRTASKLLSHRWEEIHGGGS